MVITQLMQMIIYGINNMTKCTGCKQEITVNATYSDTMGNSFCLECLPKCCYRSEIEDECLCNTDETERFEP